MVGAFVSETVVTGFRNQSFKDCGREYAKFEILTVFGIGMILTVTVRQCQTCVVLAFNLKVLTFKFKLKFSKILGKFPDNLK